MCSNVLRMPDIVVDAGRRREVARRHGHEHVCRFRTGGLNGLARPGSTPAPRKHASHGSRSRAYVP